ncbi:hypothetical protein BASA50_006705 [Batrachochytrium salamandrivorans]|uniref:Uncharacterized protein n=1 Tax=Batrachochytrium salamandrivorans TaxID=1357716 RepID=A0ABQ8FAP6_9FUNG|nr:hypothetical protein BASA62_008645 [Batrachochytrium salamandrivorans]KAH6594458.1 hypothetical protein BASA50_006705 [Batrachochytrium salamandrivorans]KAH9253255.1 hypothetical protein BASA81_008766 [Batrachochytrium salamandrivorans]
MKLISFAAVSLLAITVSAYPGLGSDGQDLEEPQGNSAQGEQESQSTVSQGEQGSDQDRDQSDFMKLKSEYEKKQELLVTLSNDFESIKKDINTLKDLITNAEAKLEDTNLSDEQRLALEKKRGDYEGEKNELFSELISTAGFHTKTKQECDQIKEKMDALATAL